MRPVILLVLALSSAGAQAQLINWTTPGSGNWAVPSNWDLGHAPILNEIVYIDNGATVFFTNGATPPLDTVMIGSEKFFSGTMEISAGTINSNIFIVGNAGQGSLLLSGTGTINTGLGMGIGIESNAANGFMQMDSGTLNAGVVFYVGNIGTGEFVLNDGTVTTQTQIVAHNNNSIGRLTLAGGTLDVTTSITWGNNGYADVVLSGTAVTSDTLDLAPNSTGTADLLFTDGSITTGEFRIGWDGAAVVTQTGGSLDCANIRIGNGSGDGTHNLSGGSVTTGQVFRGPTGINVFSMTGGTLNAVTIGEPVVPFDLAPTGGIITPGGPAIGTTTVHGNLNLGAAATLHLQIQATHDQILVNGLTQLAGSLTVELGTTPADDESFVLLDNDGADPISGTFAGLGEGSSLTLNYSGSNYRFEISYLGGDGNDAILTNVTCPVDFNNDGILDSGDINAFIALFLASDPAADLNNDGFVDNGDIGQFITLFLAGC